MTRRADQPALRFRAADPADTDRVVALVESAYRGESSRQGWTTEADLLDGQRTDAAQVKELLDRTQSVVLLTETGASLVACCHLERRSEISVYFGMFAVRPDLQGRGIGRATIEECRRIARGWGGQEMRMTVIGQRADLIAWYARQGFIPTGETEPFPYGDERYGIPRRNDLHFVVLSRLLD